MIDMHEFLDRCEDARTGLLARHAETARLERELRALCALTGYRVETGSATHAIERWLTVFNDAGDPVCSGPAEEVLQGLVEEFEPPDDAPFAFLRSLTITDQAGTRLFETPRDVVSPAGFLRGLADSFDRVTSTG